MNKVIPVALITTGLLAGFLTYKVKTDFNEGNIPIIERVENNEFVEFSYKDYDLTNPLHKVYSNIFVPKEIKDKEYKYNFLETDIYDSKNVYTIRNDIKAMSYSFDENSESQQSYLKKLQRYVFKKNVNFLKTTEVKSIDLNLTSNVMQTDYVIEFKEPKTVSELYAFTSKVIEMKKEGIWITESDFLNKNNSTSSFLSGNIYKKLNISISFSQGKMVVRNLVSERLEKSETKMPYRRVYNSK